MPTQSATKIADAFIDQARSRELDVGQVEADLALLADSVVIESFDASSEAISVADDGTFSGEGTVYMSLKYPDLVIGEEVPVRFKGEIDQTGQVSFSSLAADISPLSE